MLRNRTPRRPEPQPRVDLFTVEVEYFPITGYPQQMTFRYIETPANDALPPSEVYQLLLRQIKRFMYLRLQPILQPSRPTRQGVLESIRGMLSVFGRGRAYTNTISGPHADTSFTNMNTFDTGYLANMVEQIQQSNDEIEVRDLTWMFFIDPVTYARGGSGGVKLSWYKDKWLQSTLQEHWDEQGIINCAAYALNLLTKTHQELEARYKRTPELMRTDARELQTRLGWGEMVGVDELKRFVELFPKHRLTCIFMGVKDHRQFTFEGAEFDATIFEDLRQIRVAGSTVLYLYLDAASRHYIALRTPGTLLTAMTKSKSVHFCHRCTMVYRDQNHSCEATCTGTTQPKNTRKRKCRYCGVYSSVCNCEAKRCPFCTSKIKKKGDIHRCIVTKTAEPSKDKRDYYKGGEADGSFYALWAYDLEARIQHVPVENETINEFEVDQDGYYTGNCVLVEKIVNQHVANLVVCRNVFTDEEKIFEGTQCNKEIVVCKISYGSCILLIVEKICVMPTTLRVTIQD